MKLVTFYDISKTIKTIVFIGFLLLTIICIYSCESKEITISLEVKECKRNNTVLSFSNMSLLKNGVLIQKFDIENELPKILKIEELGEYEIVYLGLLEKFDTIKLSIKENKNYPITICYDEFSSNQQTKKSLLDNFTSNDHLKIRFYSRGCAHEKMDSIMIFKKGINLVAKKDDYTSVLTQEAINSFKKFEREIELINEKGSCTTDDEYTIIFNNTNLKYVERSCYWDGFEWLRKEFFKK